MVPVCGFFFFFPPVEVVGCKGFGIVFWFWFWFFFLFFWWLGVEFMGGCGGSGCGSGRWWQWVCW